MRKLVTVRKVQAVIPIAGADVIELVRIDGWQSVVKKGSFKVGDLGVYFEIDSFLPESDARYSFLKNPRTFNDIRGFRIKTMLLQKNLSQGLFLPLSDFPEIKDINDDNLTELLGVQKWEAPVPACLGGEVYGYLPGYLHKTDQERIQNYWVDGNPFNNGTEFEVTVKLDGTSCQFNWQTMDPDNNNFLVCGRVLNFKPSPNNTFWQIAQRYDLCRKMGLMGRQLSIQGEVIGEGLQKNPEKLRGQDFYVYDVYDIVAHKFLGREERLGIVEQLGLKNVPFIEVRKFDFATIEEVLTYAEGKSLNAETREGVVFKSLDGNCHFKAISNSYLLKHSDIG